jgi:hypothetical protein
MTILPNLRYTGTDLGDDRTATGFDIGSKCFDLEREKPCLLLEYGAVGSQTSSVDRKGFQQPTKTSERS